VTGDHHFMRQQPKLETLMTSITKKVDESHKQGGHTSVQLNLRKFKDVFGSNAQKGPVQNII
jgi:hypothetical protein